MAQAGVEQRHVVESYTDYGDAEHAVDRLSDDGFPVERLTIVARDLKLVENIVGRRGYGDASRGGAVTGGVVGALLGFVFGVLSWVDPLISGLSLAFAGFFVGMVVGVAVGLLAHWLSAGRRDFSSVSSLRASRYDVVADNPERAEQAARRLEASSRGRSAAATGNP